MPSVPYFSVTVVVAPLLYGRTIGVDLNRKSAMILTQPNPKSAGMHAKFPTFLKKGQPFDVRVTQSPICFTCLSESLDRTSIQKDEYVFIYCKRKEVEEDWGFIHGKWIT
eukprot:UN01947